MHTTTVSERIRPLSTSQLIHVADIHRAAFPDSALTALGHEAVRRYYEWQLCGPHDAVALGCFVGDELAGFCFGGIFRGALSGFVRRNRRFLAWRVLTHPWLLANPLFRDRLALGRRVSRTSASNVPPRTRSANASFGILALATHPDYRRRGVARELMEMAERLARQRGFDQMSLTVHPTNTPAVQFYQELGWRRQYANDGWGGLMTQSLSVDASQGESVHASGN